MWNIPKDSRFFLLISCKYMHINKYKHFAAGILWELGHLWPVNSICTCSICNCSWPVQLDGHAVLVCDGWPAVQMRSDWSSVMARVSRFTLSSIVFLLLWVSCKSSRISSSTAAICKTTNYLSIMDKDVYYDCDALVVWHCKLHGDSITQKNTKPVYLENHVNKRIPLGFVLCTYNSSLVMESRRSESVLYFGCVIMTGQIMCTLIVLNFSSISEYS